MLFCVVDCLTFLKTVILYWPFIIAIMKMCVNLIQIRAYGFKRKKLYQILDIQCMLGNSSLKIISLMTSSNLVKQKD